MVLGPQREVKSAVMFQFELSPVPTALIDKRGCLRTSNKTVLFKCIGLCDTTPTALDVVLVDAGQLIYRIVWPVAGTTKDLAASFSVCLNHYPPGSNNLVLFVRYDPDTPCVMNGREEKEPRKSYQPLPLPFHAEKLSYTMSGTRVCST